jgi:hypothetical protein
VLLGKREARIVFATSTVGILLVYSLAVPSLFQIILLILYFVLFGALIERGLLPPQYWPFQRRIGLLDLAISAACLVAALASAMGILLLRSNRVGMLTFGALMVLLVGGGTFFFAKGMFFGQRR